MAEQSQSTTNWGAILGGAAGVASAYSSYQSGRMAAKGYESQALAYNMKARGLKHGQRIAKLQGKITALNLNTHFNDAMANQVVMNAAQGRRGATVESLASSAEKQYNWDLDYSELSTQYEIHGLKAEEHAALAAEAGSRAMASESRRQGKIGMYASLIGAGASLAKIG